MAHTYITSTMAADDQDLVYLEKYGHRACFVIEIVDLKCIFLGYTVCFLVLSSMESGP